MPGDLSQAVLRGPNHAVQPPTQLCFAPTDVSAPTRLRFEPSSGRTHSESHSDVLASYRKFGLLYTRESTRQVRAACLRSCQATTAWCAAATGCSYRASHPKQIRSRRALSDAPRASGMIVTVVFC